jgi:hypothetical protein
MRLVLRTEDLEATMRALEAHDIALLEGIVEAPGFFKFITLQDPDGNIIHIGEYFRDPLRSK